MEPTLVTKRHIFVAFCRIKATTSSLGPRCQEDSIRATPPNAFTFRVSDPDAGYTMTLDLQSCCL